MSFQKLSDLHGPVSKCKLCLPAVNVHKQFCKHCFGRGYVALCLNCDGKGKMRVPVAGSVGEMDSTCNPCGGEGTFPSTKAAYDAQPDVLKEECDRVASEEFPLQADSEKVRLMQPADIAR